MWDRFFNRMRQLDERQISDEARRYAADETNISERPEDTGAWVASMEIAFEAGRRWEQIQPKGDP